MPNHIAIMTNGWYDRTPVATVGSTPANDPVRSKIRQAALYALRNRITEGGSAIRYSAGGSEAIVSTAGYFNTMRRAYDPPRSIEELEEYPCCNVLIEDGFSQNSSDTRLGQNQGLLHNSFILAIDCFLQDINDQALAQDRILADVQKYFGINFGIPDSDGYATAFNCYYESNIPHGIRNTAPNCGILIRFRVWYRQQLINPGQSG